jgi:uncharacterized protein YndB with AHSA1/START domain
MEKDMDKTLLATATLHIEAPPSKVWRALTDPAMIKQYLFGTEVSSSWQVGSPITYRGVWQGKPYEDKGTILQVEPEKLLVSSFWSALEGKPDLPENYKTVRYELLPEGSGTRVAIGNDNNDSPEAAEHTARNWQMVLEGLKKLLEA